MILTGRHVNPEPGDTFGCRYTIEIGSNELTTLRLMAHDRMDMLAGIQRLETKKGIPMTPVFISLLMEAAYILNDLNERIL